MVAALLLGGCDTLARQSAEYRQQHAIPAGSALVIEQAVPVAPGRRDVYIQYGRVQRSGIVDRYALYCELVLRYLYDQARSVAPGRYLITSAEPYIDRHGVSHGTVWYAAIGFGIGIGGDPAPSPQLYALRLRLQGPPGSDVKELICGELYDPYEARYPTIDEIRAALGRVARLDLLVPAAPAP